ncbi:putative fimbrial protein [Escherichia coli]|uniref:Putative fimbrial protein n=1 Tax=Escherichia coli TaxID=562 RepID=A0A377BTD4_ECOLX|nr:putative fimbrial protein [Escherichia coli]
MSHKFLAGRGGYWYWAGWGVSGLAVAGSDIKQVDLTLRILVDGPPPCSVKGSAVGIWQCGDQQDRWYQLPTGCEIHPQLR